MHFDSDMSRDEALAQNPAHPCPYGILQHQDLVTAYYWGFDGKERRGQLVIHRELVADVIALLTRLHADRFPIGSMIPIADPRFAWDDEASMAANNASGFNYRTIAGTSKLSHHAFGRALDLNPVQNPIVKAGVISPSGAVYDPSMPGTFRADDPYVSLMKSRGWEWGGDWNEPKDYHHFQKP